MRSSFLTRDGRRPWTGCSSSLSDWSDSHERLLLVVADFCHLPEDRLLFNDTATLLSAVYDLRLLLCLLSSSDQSLSSSSKLRLTCGAAHFSRRISSASAFSSHSICLSRIPNESESSSSFSSLLLSMCLFLRDFTWPLVALTARLIRLPSFGGGTNLRMHTCSRI